MDDDDAGWAPYPVPRPPQPIVLIEAFGSLRRHHVARDVSAGDLSLVFHSRAEMMGWSAPPGSDRGSLWSVHEAALTAGTDASRVGWVQVGLDAGASLPQAVPPLVQCLDDALTRFGRLECSALQLTAAHLKPSPASEAYLASGLVWLTHGTQPRTRAFLAFDDRVLGEHALSAVLAHLRRSGGPVFSFGPVLARPEGRAVGRPRELPLSAGFSPARRGIALALPAWSAAAMGWALAAAVDAVLSITPAREFALRLSRLR